MASLSTAVHAAALWTHPEPRSTRMWDFKQLVNDRYDLNLQSYADLHQWSIDHVPDFWEEVWRFTGVTASRQYAKVLEPDSPMFPRPDFFQGSLLNFAENLLYPTHVKINPDATAVIAATESTRSLTTWKELRERVRQCAAALRTLGVQSHDRVAGFLGNHVNTIVVMLAATSLGATWTAVSPDTGIHAVLDRLEQIEPVVLFADNGSEYNGKFHSSIEKIQEIARGLKGLTAVVVFPTVAHWPVVLDGIEVANGHAWSYDGFLKTASSPSLPLAFSQQSPSHPLYILYSSGTTGKPKCIVHSTLGTLIQHKKEHVLHCDIRPGDRFFYYTTCTWMMWHWLVSGLASGATLVLYDGSPFKPFSRASMPRLIKELQITHFGTSAKYLSMLEQDEFSPKEECIDLSSLKAIYSTGSPLAPSTFRYVYNTFPKSINLGSITGGTDIISLFGAPSPLSPVYAGEIQVIGLGMDVQAYDPSGKAIQDGEPGDLVCVKPFPCQPVAFFGSDGGKKYRSSYFETFPNVWHHGDFIRINPKSGGLVMLGRSDGILKPSGVRFGSAEIYNILLKHFAAEVEDALCIGRRRETDCDESVVLFLLLKECVVLDLELKKRVCDIIRKDLSARHVPAIIDQCFEIPVTTNGKK